MEEKILDALTESANAGVLFRSQSIYQIEELSLFNR